MVIVLVLTFICLFEFGPGPVAWLYMAEIMQDKAISIAVVMNWLVNLVISAVIPPLIEAIGDENIGWIFIVLGIAVGVCFLIMVVFMKETRGKTA